MQRNNQSEGTLPGVLANLKGAAKAALESRGFEYLLCGTLAVAVVSSPAFAGADTTFNAVATQFENWAEGSLGKTVAVGGLLVALLNAMTNFNWKFFGSAAGVGLAGAIGPNIASSMVTATI